jgi:hypothetical protein
MTLATPDLLFFENVPVVEGTYVTAALVFEYRANEVNSLPAHPVKS